jgi:nicotinamide-nucleotide amidase
MMPQSLAQEVGELLRTRRLKLATAESCTGGLVGSLVTDVPGSSEYYLGGVVVYAYEAKTLLLGISQEFLWEHGAVSQETATAMAQSIRPRLQADIGLGVTGILGPGGGTAAKPVGLVFIALSAAGTDWCRRFLWEGTRLENKQQTAKTALGMLKEYLSSP